MARSESAATDCAFSSFSLTSASSFEDLALNIDFLASGLRDTQTGLRRFHTSLGFGYVFGRSIRLRPIGNFHRDAGGSTSGGRHTDRNRDVPGWWKSDPVMCRTGHA